MQMTTHEAPRGTTAAKEKTKKSSMISGLMGRSKRNKEKEDAHRPSGVPTSGGVDIRSVLQNDEVLSGYWPVACGAHNGRKVRHGHE